jgi:hypothetical protein
LNLDPEHRTVINPDDPDGDDTETIAWWAPSDAAKNPALREECKATDWARIDAAVPNAEFKLAAVIADLEKAAMPRPDDTDRERHIKQIAAITGAALAAHALGVARENAAIGKQTDAMVARLRDHYRQAVRAGSHAASLQHGVAPLTDDQVDQIATARAEAQRDHVRALVQQSRTGTVPGQTVANLSRGAKPAYENGFAAAVTSQHPDAQCVWHVMSDDPCSPCAGRDGEVFTADTLPGYPGDGDFGGDLCEGGPNDRCELHWIVTPADADSGD